MNPHRVREPIDKFDETPAKYPSKFPPADSRTPYVIIVGAGIGGLFLAILLERAGIRYEIFERASEIKPLGSIMGINANILPVLEQLGIYEEFAELSFAGKKMNLRHGNMDKIAVIEQTEKISKALGYDYRMLYRHSFIEFLLSKIPKDKIHFNKKVLSIVQNKDGAMIRCADDTTYHGDILVGADGAYSGVRQSLYKQLSDKNELPPSDAKDMHKGYTCLVGTTGALDPEKFPFVNKGHCDMYQIIGQGTPYTWSIFNVPDNRICWAVVRQFETEAECEDEKFRNSEWGADKSGAMIESIRDFKTPFGTMGDLVDLTPKDRISRVYLEDKLFETWNYGRTALIGDAAHKLLPGGGQGAVCAMQDAVILTNCLYDLKSLKQQDVETALQDYREQRYHQVKIQVDNSNDNAFLLTGQTFMERVIRYVVFHWLPQSVKTKAIIKDASYRPQLAFLPLAPKRGTGFVQPQKPSKRYEEEEEEERKKREVEEKKKRKEEGGDEKEKVCAAAV